MAKASGEDSPKYKVAWQYSGEGIKDMTFPVDEIFEAIMNAKDITHERLITNQNNERSLPKKKELFGKMKSMFNFNPDDVEGLPMESDEEQSDVEYPVDNRISEGSFTQTHSIYKSDSKKRSFYTDNFLNYNDLDPDENDCLDHNLSTSDYFKQNGGLKWKKDLDMETPKGLRPMQKTRLLPDTRYKFRTELESFLALLPMKFWIIHVNETNRYMRTEYYQRLIEKNPNMKVVLKEVDINELMKFYAIIFQMALKPFPGERYTSCWKENNKKWYTACQHMSRKRFQVIRSCLHWCDNSMKHYGNQNVGKQDTLYKIRFFLNTIKELFGKYLEPGTDLSLDETCVAIRSLWARAMTFYNPMKPKGKHHLKFYTLCDMDSWCALVVKMCHRYKKEDKNMTSNTKEKLNSKDDNSFDISTDEDYVIESDDEGRLVVDVEQNDSDLNEGNEIQDETLDYQYSGANMEFPKKAPSQSEKMAQKTVATVTEMCEKYKGSGRIINMDNLYSSPLVFLELKKMSLYARGTVRNNRKYLPRFIKYLKKDTKRLKRGTYQYAVNEENQMSMHCWNDNHPVHVLSTADATFTSQVKRQQGVEKIDVDCPKAIKSYNKNMQAVDQFNRLMSLFSLSESHTFTKYYKKVAMVLMDFVLVNAYLHHKLFIESESKDKSNPGPILDRKVFMENLIEALLHTDFSQMAREEMKKNEKNERKNKDADNNLSDDEKSLTSSSSCGNFYNDDDDNDLKEINANENDKQGKNKDLFCRAVSIDNNYLLHLPLQKRYKLKPVCKVCQFEGRGNTRKGTVFCKTHALSLCQRTHPHPNSKDSFIICDKKIDTIEINDWKWLSPNQEEWTCWEKAHLHYIPKGLFKQKKKNSDVNVTDIGKYARIDFQSEIFKARKDAFHISHYKKIGLRKSKPTKPIKASRNRKERKHVNSLALDVISSSSTIANAKKPKYERNMQIEFPDEIYSTSMDCYDDRTSDIDENVSEMTFKKTKIKKEIDSMRPLQVPYDPYMFQHYGNNNICNVFTPF